MSINFQPFRAASKIILAISAINLVLYSSLSFLFISPSITSMARRNTRR